jgi:hypothetical protein
MSDLTSIKPGDTVGMISGYNGCDSKIVGVAAVTKAHGGTIIAEDSGRKFDMLGRERGGSRYHSADIYRLDHPEWIRRGKPIIRRNMAGDMLRALETMNDENLWGDEEADALKALYQRMIAKRKASPE